MSHSTGCKRESRNVQTTDVEREHLCRGKRLWRNTHCVCQTCEWWFQW
jgi:hypothetical protein